MCIENNDKHVFKKCTTKTKIFKTSIKYVDMYLENVHVYKNCKMTPEETKKRNNKIHS